MQKHRFNPVLAAVLLLASLFLIFNFNNMKSVVLGHKTAKIETITANKSALHGTKVSKSQMYAKEKINYGSPVVPWEGTKYNPAAETLHAGHVLYYQMNLPVGSHYYNIWMDAIQAWNNLGVITLAQKPADYPYHDYITLDGDDNRSHIDLTQTQREEGDYEVGITNFDYDDAYNGYSKMTGVTSKLTANGLDSTHRDQLIDAEHELGHALGFAHDTKNYGTKDEPKYVVMNPNVPLRDEFQPLGQLEKNALIAVYGARK